MWRRCLVACFAAIAVWAGAAELQGNVVLTLHGALTRDGQTMLPLDLEFPCRGGKWPERFWGYAVWYSRGHHEGVVKLNELRGGKRLLEVEVEIGGDPWTPGGHATYTIEVSREGKDFAGTYSGTFAKEVASAGGPKRTDDLPEELRKMLQKSATAKPAPRPQAFKLSGRVIGKLSPPWPGLVEGHVAVKPGEHPRIPFRKSQLPLLRKRAAETPEGKAMLQRTIAVLGNPGHKEGDKFTTWPAVGYGFAWLMTGKREYAEKARQIVEETVFENPAGRRGRGISQDIHHGPRLLGLALAFDLCYDAWDRAFRLKCVDEIQRRVRECATGQFEGRRMSGFNPNPWSNHNAIRVGAMGVGALAVLGERNSKGRELEDAEGLADIAGREVRDYFRMGLGGSGWCMEGAFYKVMTMQRGFVHFLHAYENVLGRKVGAGPLGDFDIVGYFMESPPGQLIPKLDDICWTAGLITVPDDVLPGVKWLMERAVGLKGNHTYGIGHALLAPFLFARYPFEVEEKPPWECFPWMAPDRRKGHWVFRPTVRDKDDILLVLNLKSEILRACHYERAGVMSDLQLWGLGRKWLSGQYLLKVRDKMAINTHHGPVVTSWRHTPDRTCVLNVDLAHCYLRELRVKKGSGVNAAELAASRGAVGVVRWPSWGAPLLDLGIRGTRSMAIDCSGKSGSPLLVAIADRISDRGKPVPSVWYLPLAKGIGKPRVEENRFVVGEGDGPTLSGGVVAPKTLPPGQLAGESDGGSFVVFTIQKGRPPEFRLQGEGLNATVRVGGRTVRCRDGILTLE